MRPADSIAHRRYALARRRRAGRPGARDRAGMTLIEAALVTVIVGTGILGMMQLFASLHQQTAAANRATVAMFLAENIQEAMADLPFRDPDAPGFRREEPNLPAWDDVDDWTGWSSRQTGDRMPIDSLRQSIPELAQYGQIVAVEPVNPHGPSIVEANPDPEAVRITVIVTFQPNPGNASSPDAEVHRLSWVRMRD
jgi:hypothetical protein